jgi:hypothetical protein
MPRMFRIMKKGADEKPTVGQTATTLGIRPGEIDLDASGNVILNDKGMSVNPEWRAASIFLIPKRLGTGGRGSRTSHCFRRGTAPFQQAPCGAGLELLPESPTHGVVRPAQPVLLAQYEADLHATRLEWEVDET